MPDDVFKGGSYVVTGNTNQLSEAKGYYAVREDGATRTGVYAVNTSAHGSPRQQAYVALANPATAISLYTYLMESGGHSLQNVNGYTVLLPPYPPYADLTVEFPFVDKRFPTAMSYGTSGGPQFQTSLFKTASGVEYAQADWDRIRARYSVEFSYVPGKDLEEIENFFHMVRGRALGFRFKDWNDYQIVDQNVLVGDGTSHEFQLFKRYRSGPGYFDRMIKKPVRESIKELYLDDQKLIAGREFFVSSSTGIISFVTPPVAGAVGRIPYAEFDVPVRFETDQLTASADDHDQYSLDSLDIIEILV